MSDYLFPEIESRWQQRWAEARTFEVTEDPARTKFYCLEMLPYPSGDIHVGHVRNYCITDVVARFKRMRGFNVLHPIGWDALGLPAENAAIKRGVHPEKWTRDNIAGMKRAAPAARLQLSLEPRDRDLRSRVLPLEPVVLPAHARAGHRLPREGGGQLVPVLPDRARERAGGRAGLLALPLAGRGAGARPVVPAHHRLPGRAARRHGAAPRRGPSACCSSSATGSAARTAPRWTSALDDGTAAPRLHDAHRHDLRRDVHGAGARAPARRRPGRGQRRRESGGRASARRRTGARAWPARSTRKACSRAITP